MLIDCIKREFDSKLTWLLILNLVPFAQIFYYFMIYRKDVKSLKKGKAKHIETLALISIIIAIIAMMMFTYFGFIFGVAAIILGVLGKKKIDKNPSLGGRELAKAGFILGIIALALQILFIVLYFGFLGTMMLYGIREEIKDNSGLDLSDLDFNGTKEGAIGGVLQVGETKTYTLYDDEAYEITLFNITENSAMFDVNDEVFEVWVMGASRTLSDGGHFFLDYITNVVDSENMTVEFYLDTTY